MKDLKRDNFIDFLRAAFCIAVLLYHLNILKGGYLAVCSFFVLSGYLAVSSLASKEKINFKDYYLGRIKRVYIPLLVVTFASVGAISLLKSIVWVSLKPETTSVLLGYNNFWQIGANLDYFARHTDSPFMHFWYIAILLQFTLVAPILIFGLNKLKEKTSEKVLFITLAVISLSTTGYFIYAAYTKDAMSVYYSTFSRMFSIWVGILLGYSKNVLKDFFGGKHGKNAIAPQDIAYGCLGILIVMFIFIPASSNLYPYAMVLTSILSAVCIGLSFAADIDKGSFLEKASKFVSDISYEVYLVQYPLIFIFSYMLSQKYAVVLTIMLSFGLGFLLNKSLNMGFSKKVSIASLAIVVAISGFGGAEFAMAKDHTEELVALEEELARNQEILLEKQAEFARRQAEEKEELDKQLEELTNSENSIDEFITNIDLMAFGDSVLLGASEELINWFPNSYCDAQKNRTGWAILPLVRDLSDKGMLSKTVLINVGANGDCQERVKDQIMEYCKDADVFWVNTTYDQKVHVNDKLKAFTEKYDNAHYIDWENLSKGHADYFGSDGIHLTVKGRKAYSQVVFDTLKDFYLAKIEVLKEEALEKSRELFTNNICFFGDDLILNIFDNLSLSNDNLVAFVNEYEDSDSLCEAIRVGVSDDTLSKKIVLGFSKNNNYLDDTSLDILSSLCDGRMIYVIKTDDIEYPAKDNVLVIDFSKEIKLHKEYMAVDKIHLSAEGEDALSKLIEEKVINN